MDNQFEATRDIWTQAFFTGDYDVLRQYEHDDFKVIYEQEDRVEANYTRYDRIAHAVQNGVWKPQKLNVEFEEFEYNHDQTECYVLIGLEDTKQQIAEKWQFNEGWQIVELRFLKPKKQAV